MARRMPNARRTAPVPWKPFISLGPITLPIEFDTVHYAETAQRSWSRRRRGWQIADLRLITVGTTGRRTTVAPPLSLTDERDALWLASLDYMRFMTLARPPCPQGLNIDRRSGLVKGRWCAVHGAFVPWSIVDGYVHYLDGAYSDRRRNANGY